MDPMQYATLVGRPHFTMPTRLGKPLGQCTKADMERIVEIEEASNRLIERALERGGATPAEGEAAEAAAQYQRELWAWALVG